MKRIAILGSTGSIGTTALKIIRQYPREFKVEALSANRNTGALARQIEEFHPSTVVVADKEAALRFKKEYAGGVSIDSGIEGLNRIASAKNVDIVLIALSGRNALFPLLKAIEHGKRIALSNKEALVMAGGLVMDRLAKSNAALIPIDSEQSAIFQCMEGRGRDQVNKLYLTASGGPLHAVALKDFKKVTVRQILDHPRWKMGKKITVDSATLMNKGLEVIEARWLFDIDIKHIEVLIHRQAIIHSMVEFIDGVVLAQLGITDMVLPMQYALTYPFRFANNKYRLNFLKTEPLSFEKPDIEKFPCLDFAFCAACDSGLAPCVLNAANEEAVDAFLNRRIAFTSIPKIIEKVLAKHKNTASFNLEDILSADGWARQEAERFVEGCRF